MPKLENSTQVKPGEFTDAEPQVTKPLQAKPNILMLAEKMPLEPRDGQKQTVTIHHEFGYWTLPDRHLIEEIAKLKILHVIEVVDGKAR